MVLLKKKKIQIYKWKKVTYLNLSTNLRRIPDFRQRHTWNIKNRLLQLNELLEDIRVLKYEWESITRIKVVVEMMEYLKIKKHML